MKQTVTALLLVLITALGFGAFSSTASAAPAGRQGSGDPCSSEVLVAFRVNAQNDDSELFTPLPDPPNPCDEIGPTTSTTTTTAVAGGATPVTKDTLPKTTTSTTTTIPVSVEAPTPQVLGATATATTAATAAPVQGELALTGKSALPLGLVGVSLAALGAGLLLAQRKRRLSWKS